MNGPELVPPGRVGLAAQTGLYPLRSNFEDRNRAVREAQASSSSNLPAVLTVNDQSGRLQPAESVITFPCANAEVTAKFPGVNWSVPEFVKDARDLLTSPCEFSIPCLWVSEEGTYLQNETRLVKRLPR